MALSGKISTTGWNDGSGTPWRATFNWTASQNLGENSTTISWVLIADTAAKGQAYYRPITIRFDGAIVYSKDSSNSILAQNGTVLASGTKTFTHDKYGMRSVTVGIAVGIENYNTNCNALGTLVFNDIPRVSTVTVNTAEVGQTTKITVTKQNDSFTHTLEYVFGSFSETIFVKTSATSINWTIPESFYNEMTNVSYRIGTMYCDTYSGDTYIGTTTAQFRVNVPTDIGPTFEVTFAEGDAEVAAVTGGNYFLKYISDAKYTIAATASHGATIKEYSIRNGDTTLTTASGIFPNVSSAYYYVTVTDSRGLSTTKTVSKPIQDYTKTTCNLWLKSVDPDGTVVMGVDGQCFSRDFYGAGQENTFSLSVSCEGPDGTITTLQGTPTIEDFEYEDEVTFTGLDYKLTYIFTATAADRLTSATSQEVAVTTVPVFDWSKTDFRFNVPITKIGEYEFADFVIATGTASMGTNGTWYWRKWKSGRAECYGSRNFGRISLSKAWVSGTSHTGYRSAPQNQALPADLFVDTPEVIEIRLKYTGSDSATSTNGGYISIMGESGSDNYDDLTLVVPSKDNTGSFVIAHPFYDSSYTYPATHIGFNIIGRWK